MTTSNACTEFSGHENTGLQVGSNAGHFHVHYNRQSDFDGPRPRPSSTVPFRRDPGFIDRGYLDQIHEKCSEPASRTALVGLGGIGKSQLAIEYSYQIRENDPSIWVFWIFGGSASRFEEGYRTIADRVKIPRRDEPGVDVIPLVNAWLSDEDNGRWIMILDNVDDLALLVSSHEQALRTDRSDSNLEAAAPLSSTIPQTPNGSMLVTSRNQNAALRLVGNHSRDIIYIEPMVESHALQLLQKKAGHEIDGGDAVRLVQALDYMPLAISQAGAFINHRAPRITISRYFDILSRSDQDRASLLNRDMGDIRRDPSASNSIITTWQISFEHIRKQRPSAARLLSLMSLFDRQGAPEWVLRRYNKKDRGAPVSVADTNCADGYDKDYWRKSANITDIDFDDDISTLTNYSLIRATEFDGTLFEMHRLVQFSTQRWLESSGDLEVCRARYTRVLNKVFPNGKYKTWVTCRALFPHVKVVLNFRPINSQHLQDYTAVLEKAVYYAGEIGDYSIAEKMCRRALEEREKESGAENPETLDIIHELAGILCKQGKYQAAEEMIVRAVKRSESAFGAEDQSTLSSIVCLATILRNQSQYEAAETMYRRVLKIDEYVRGVEHSNTLTCVHNLAHVLHAQGKLKAAEKLYDRVSRGRKKTLRRNYSNTIPTVLDLASLYCKQNRFRDAEKLYQRGLRTSEKMLGKEHPRTLTIVHDLATFYFVQKRCLDAELLYQRALGWDEEALGKENQRTLKTINSLANLYQMQKRYGDAEILFHRALKSGEKTLGKEHQQTLETIHSLAVLYHMQKRYSNAEPLYQRACAGLRATLGPDDQWTIDCSRDYSRMLEDSKATAIPEVRQSNVEERSTDGVKRGMDASLCDDERLPKRNQRRTSSRQRRAPTRYGR